MLGHKRGQCPNGVSGTTDTEIHVVTDVSAQLDSLHITDDDKATKEKVTNKGRRRSSLKQIPVEAEALPSLASHDRNALNELLKPGIMTDEVREIDEEKARESIERWLEALSFTNLSNITPKKAKARNSMPPGIYLISFEIESGTIAH